MQKDKKSMRIMSFLLVLLMVTTLLLPILKIPVRAATANDSLMEAIEDHIDGRSDNDVYGLDLSNNPDIYGDVDIAELKDRFPNLAFVDLSGTNVTSIANIAAISRVDYVDTFASGERTFKYTDNTVVYRESEGNLDIAALLDEIVIHSSVINDDMSIPAGMIIDDNVTITIGSGSPELITDGIIPQSSLLSNSSGTHIVTLNFDVAYAISTPSIPQINLEIKKSGYSLTPSSGTVYDGGYIEFTLTRFNEDGNQVALEATSFYNVKLDAGVNPNLNTSLTISADNMKITIRVAAAELGSTSATLQVFKADNPNALLAAVEVIKASNEELDDIRFIEKNGSSLPISDPIESGDTIYSKGGTTISSAVESNIIDGTYQNTTIYLLQGRTVSNPQWGYIPERYKNQIEIIIGDNYELSSEIIAVPNPMGTPGNVLALVVTSKTAGAANYAYHDLDPTTKPINVILNNLSTTAEAYLNVNVHSNSAKGYMIYQVPSIYSNYSKAEIEEAIAQNDPLVKMVAQYKFVGNSLDEVVVPGVTIVEDSTIYLVSTAYYEDDGQAFIVPDSLINGWYHTDTDASNMFVDSPWKFIGIPSTSMEAMLNSSTSFSSDTIVLEVRTNELQESETVKGNLVFAPKGGSNYVGIPITKVEKEIIDYIIAPVPYTGGINIFDELQNQIAAYNADAYDAITNPYVPGTYKLYELNVMGEDTIAIGGVNHYEVYAVYSNYKTSNALYAPDYDISEDVEMISDVDPVPVTAELVSLGSGKFDAKATSSGGVEDALVGETVDMTYSDGSISSKTITLTIDNSAVNGLYLVFEDKDGKLYSSAPELYENIDEINELEDNYQIPKGETFQLYSVFAFGNEDFFDGVSDWTIYIADIADINFNLSTPAYVSFASSSTTYIELKGDTVGASDTVYAEWNGATSIMIGSDTFTIESGAMSATDSIEVVPPLVVGIYANDSSSAPISNNTPVQNNLSDYIVGEKWDTAPYIYLSDLTGDDISVLTSGDDYFGSLELVSDNDLAADIDDYELGFRESTTLNIWYEYTYVLNGEEITYTLKYYDSIAAAVSTDDYKLSIDIGYPAIEKVFLVASDSSAGMLTWHGSDIAYHNRYTLPYNQYSTIRLYPVVMNSRVKLDANYSDFSLLEEISVDDIATDSDYFDYLQADDIYDYSFSLISGNSSLYSESVKTDDDGYIYFEITFMGEVTYENILDFEFELIDLELSAPYSGIFANNTDTLEVFHLADRDTAFVVDIATTLLSAAPHPIGEKCEWTIDYMLSTTVEAGASDPTFRVAATYFDIPGMLTVMPETEYYNAEAYNALIIEEISVPVSGAYEITSDGNKLQIVPLIAGEYSFKIYTVNNDGKIAPYFNGQYQEISFIASPSLTDQTIRWGETDALNIPTSITNWASIEEDGTSLLDASALSEGVVKMNDNVNGTATVIVKDENGHAIAEITVTTVEGVFVSRTLSPVTDANSSYILMFGETVTVCWVVMYDDGLENYTVTESTASSDWGKVFGSDDVCSFSNGIITAGNTVTGIVALKITDISSSYYEVFWITIKNDPSAVKTYDIVDNTDTSILPTLSLSVGDTIELWLYNESDDIYPTISNIFNDNDVVVLAQTMTPASYTFTLTALSAGVSNITVYSDDGGAVSFEVVVISAESTITINTQPIDVTVTEPDEAIFEIDASTTAGTLLYQWQVSDDGGLTWEDITDAESDSYTIDATDVSMDGNKYRCVLTDDNGSLRSDSALLTVNAEVSITITINTQPIDVTVTEPATATFSVSATSDGTISYQWQVSTNGGVTWDNISGATSASYTTGATAVSMNGNQYRCVLTDDNGFLRSDSALLTVNEEVVIPPILTITIITQPADVTVTKPATATFSVSATSDGTISYQWQVSTNGGVTWDNISGATSASYTTGATAVSMNGNKFRCVLTTDSSTEYSNAAQLTVNEESGSGGTGSGGTGVITYPSSDSNKHVCPSAPYTDVDTELWYHEFVDYVIENGIMNGTSSTTFKVNTKLTRAMMVQILYNIENRPTGSIGETFSDVAKESWYADAIAWASSNSIVNGYGDGKFGPENEITREQMATILYRYAKFKDYDVSGTNSLSAFVDADDISSWAFEGMQWAVGTGLIIGRDETHVVPIATATRAEVATIITRFCRVYKIR